MVEQTTVHLVHLYCTIHRNGMETIGTHPAPLYFRQRVLEISFTRQDMWREGNEKLKLFSKMSVKITLHK